ncbi:MAG: PBP1A family penicillin-binding protein [bacterium]|nr:PBP1A family penicillin-binding protein [bacterium]
MWVSLRSALLVFVTLVVIASTVGILWLTSALPRLPDDLNQLTSVQPTEFYDRTGRRLSSLDGRIPVALHEMSPYFRKAVLAAEDKNFYLHAGVDKIAVLRAGINMTVLKKRMQGGSTISQQLIKNLFFTFERTWDRKIKEMFLALQLEQMFPKDKIFEGYCNSVYFGLGAYGVEAAAQSYFSKRASELSLAEAAMLAGLPNAPSRLNPFRYPERARQRMTYILSEMVATGMVSEAEAQQALSDSIRLKASYPAATGVAYFQDYLMDRLEGMLSLDLLYAGGIQVNTTLDYRLQSEVQQILRRYLEKYQGELKATKDSASGEPLQGAIVVLDAKTNEILAMSGGRDYQESQFNRAISNNRPPGSSFKPFVYFTAITQLGLKPDDIVVDAPLQVAVDDTVWEPKNFDDKYHGELVLKKALQLSLNTVSVSLIMQTTPDSVVANAKKLGITSTLFNTYSLALGATAVSPLEMAGAYASIRRLGERREVTGFRTIFDQDGKPVYQFKANPERLVNSGDVYMMRDMMRGVVDGGTGYTVRKAGFKGPCAGKTGTSNDHRDVWFVGFTAEYAVAVWIGFDDNRQLIGKNRKGWTGGDICGPVFADVLKAAYQDRTPGQFDDVSGFSLRKVHGGGGESDSITVVVPETPVPVMQP